MPKLPVVNKNLLRKELKEKKGNLKGEIAFFQTFPIVFFKSKCKIKYI